MDDIWMILNACFSQTFHWFNEAEIDCLESLPNLPRIQKIVQVWFVMNTFYITIRPFTKIVSKQETVDQELVKVRMMKMSVSDCMTTYSTTYTCFYWLCRTNASAMSQCCEPGRPENADVLCQWHRRDREGDMSSSARLVEGCGSMCIHGASKLQVAR